MADDTTTFKLDLDAESFVSAVQAAQKQVGILGNADNLSGLVKGLDDMLPIIGALSVAFLGLKFTLGEIFKGEEIKALNIQFEILAKNAGVSAESIRSGMEKASGGLLDTESQLKLANDAIVKLGGSAEKIPEIMELARKASVVTGKDLKSTFEDLTFAITSGNQRLLTHLGLRVDVTKAERDFAESVGVSVDALSDEGKHQAIMNAVLEEGKAKFAGINPDIKEATNSWEKLKVAANELKDAFAVLFEKVAGPRVTEIMNLTTQWAKNVTMYFQSAGKGVDYYRDKLKAMREEQEKATPAGGPAATSAAAAPVAKQNRFVDLEKAKLQEAEFQKALTELHKQGASEREAVVMNSAQVEQAMREKSLQLQRDYETQAELIQDKKGLTHEQKTQVLLQLEQNYQAKKTALALDGESQRQALLQRSFDNQAKATDKFYGKFMAGAHKATLQAKKDFMDFEKLGEVAVNRLGNATSQAFAQMGEGSLDLGTAMKRAILGALADEAQARGALLIASSIFPPNPLGLAAGAGLSTLAGVLRAAAGGGASSAVAGGGTAAAGGAVVGADSVAAVSSAGVDAGSASTASSRQHVTINIAGSYFDTEATRTRLTDIIRESADAADFKIQSVGGGL